MNTAVKALAYRVPQTAEMLNMSEEMVWKLLRGGQLTGFKVGTVRLISAAELERFVSEREAAEALQN